MRDTKGITLIALIITIIILLILAGITIMQLTGTGLFGKAKLANQKTRYATAKEIVNLKLMEIQLNCVEKNEEYNIIKIADGMEYAEDITIEKYYNKNTAIIKDGVLKDITNLEAIVVSVNKYSEYKFLIGEECKIIGVLEKEITDIISKQDFIDVLEFEENLSKELGESISSTKISFKPNDYTNKDSIDLLVTISNNKGIKSIKTLENNTLEQNGQTQVEIDYKVTRNGSYPFIIIDNEGKEETKSIEVNIFDKIEPKDFTPMILKTKNTNVTIKGNAEDGDEVVDSVNSIKSGIEKYEYYVNNIKKGETKDEEFQINDLVANTNYSIYLIVYDKAGNSKKSETVIITTSNGSYPTLTLNGLILPEDGVNEASGYNEILFDNNFEIFGKGNSAQSFIKFNLDSECWGKYITIYNGELPANNVFIRMDDSPSKNKNFIYGSITNLTGISYGTEKRSYSIQIPEGVGFVSVGSVSTSYTISISEIWCSEEDLTGKIYTNDNKP